GMGTLTFAGIDTIVGSNDTRDSLVDSIASPTSQWNLADHPTFTDGTHTLSFSRIDDLTGIRGNTLAFGLPGSTLPQDPTLPPLLVPGGDVVQLVETANPLFIIASATIDSTADNLVKVIGTAGPDLLRVDPSVPAAGLAVDFDARGRADS